MRLLHTADWQVGMEAARCGAASARVRAARLEAAGRVVELALAERVDAVLVAGDTFENHGVAGSDVEAVAELMGRFPCPVYVITGNHDPAGPATAWRHAAWGRQSNVTVIEEARPVDCGEWVLFPCPLKTRWGSEDPTAWIPSGNHAGRIRVGLAHGTLAGTPGAASDHPIAGEAAWRHGLDYLALGHWHSTRRYGDDDRGWRMAYSGTHEPTAFGEDASGHALVVEIDGPGAKPRIRKQRTAVLDWRAMEATVTREGELGELRRAVEELASDARLVSVRVRGQLSEEGELEALRALAARFLYFKLDEAGLRRPARLDELPEGIVKEAARRLAERASDAAAQRALEHLMRLAR